MISAFSSSRIPSHDSNVFHLQRFIEDRVYILNGVAHGWYLGSVLMPFWFNQRQQ